MTNGVTTPRGTPSLTVNSGAFEYVGPMESSPSANLSILLGSSAGDAVGEKARNTVARSVRSSHARRFIAAPVLQVLVAGVVY